MAVKPILVITTPSLTPENVGQITQSITEKVDDYHVIVVNSEYSDTEFKFEVLYEKDFNHVKYEELKQIIKDSCAH